MPHTTQSTFLVVYLWYTYFGWLVSRAYNACPVYVVICFCLVYFNPPLTTGYFLARDRARRPRAARAARGAARAPPRPRRARGRAPRRARGRAPRRGQGHTRARNHTPHA